MVPEGGVRFREVPYDGTEPHEPSRLVALALHGEMFFGLAHRLRDVLGDVVREQDPSRIVLRIRRAYSIDYSCWSALFDFARAYRRRGGELYLCGMDEVDVLTVEQAGMFKAIPRENLYVHRPGVFMALRQAVAAAAESLGDASGLSPAWSAYLEEQRDRKAGAPSGP
jgi:MFS superfamily sulfate permease-like transporter